MTPQETAARTGRRWRVLRRLIVTVSLLGVFGVAATVSGAPAASAHPLGNVTVNHYDGLELFTDHITDTAVVDTAEIPTLLAPEQPASGPGVEQQVPVTCDPSRCQGPFAPTVGVRGHRLSGCRQGLPSMSR